MYFQETSLYSDSEGLSKCGKSAGCLRGKCWSYCEATGVPNEWCYTTKGNTFDGMKVSCTKDQDCCRSWKCAGACAVV